MTPKEFELALVEAAEEFAGLRYDPNTCPTGNMIAKNIACKVGFRQGARWARSQIKINYNAAETLIRFLSTPIAKRKGVVLSKEECEEWVKELRLNDDEEESIERENNERSSQIKNYTKE